LAAKWAAPLSVKQAVTPVQKPRITILVAAWWPNKKPFQRAARWDGLMPYWPALMSQGTGPQGEQPTGSVEDELRALLAYYHQVTNEPGEILLPYRPDQNYRDLCKKLGRPGCWTQALGNLKKFKKAHPCNWSSQLLSFIGNGGSKQMIA
jgi:hypothetical protein